MFISDLKTSKKLGCVTLVGKSSPGRVVLQTGSIPSMIHCILDIKVRVFTYR